MKKALGHFVLIAALVVSIGFASALADDSAIRIGNITSSTGRFSEYASVARAEGAYFQMVNDRGGVEGRKIEFITLDNESDADQSPGLAKKLVEEDGVVCVFSSLGTETNLAMRQYLNEKHVPQLFVQSSSAVFDDPGNYPWTMGFFATYRTEGEVYAKYILQNEPGAKVAVLYADDDAGREYLEGIHAGFGEKAGAMIVKEMTYENTDATLTPQIRALKASGADVLLNMSIGRLTTRAIRTVYDINWHPLQFIPNASLSVAAFLDPAGLEKSVGIITNARSKGWLTADSRRDLAVQDFLDWMSKYNLKASLRDQNNVAGYLRAQAMVEVLKECGGEITRENIMKHASHLDLELGMLRPGIRVTTSPTDYQPIKQLFLMRFDGKNWEGFGGVIGP